MHEIFHDMKEFRFSGDVKELKLNKTQLKTLLVLYSQKESNMSTSSRVLDIEKGSFTSVIDNLIDCGLVERRRDENDRRKVRISLTEAGIMFVEDILLEMSRQVDKKLDVLSGEDKKRFVNAINDLAEITEKLGER